MKKNLINNDTITRKGLLPGWFREAGFYFLASGFAMAVNITFRNIIEVLLPFNISVVFAYFLGSFVKFYLSKIYVFRVKYSNNTMQEFIKYILVSAVGMSVTYFVSVNVLHIFIIHELFSSQLISNNLAHFAGLILGFTVNFFGHKLFSFKSISSV